MSKVRMGVDTNVFVYAIDDDAPEHRAAQKWLENAGKREFSAVVSSQNLTELYAVLTSKKAMGSKVLAPSGALEHIEMILKKDVFEVVFPNIEAIRRFGELISRLKPQGQSVHDVFLAATLLSNGVNTLLTANAKDFEKIKGLRVVELD